MVKKLIVLLVTSASAQIAPSPSPAGGPGPAAAPFTLDGVRGFVDLLPYSPDRMNYQMTKAKCIDFVNHMLDKSGHDATRLPKLMPKCLWSKEECAALEADLLSRIPSTALPGGAPGPAGAPAAALIATKQLRSKSPGSGDAVFGWCDTLYNMAKTRYFEKLEPPQPAPGMAALPGETGDINTDAKAMNRWMHKNLGGPPAPALSKAEKIWQKMKQVGSTVKTASGWDHFAPEREKAKEVAKSVSGYDHFEPERETAKKMAKGISGHDHFSKKDEKEKDDTDEEEEEK